MADLNYRPDLGGSCEGRLKPEIAETKLNKKLGPDYPRPLVERTNFNAMYPGHMPRRRPLIGLPKSFDKE